MKIFSVLKAFFILLVFSLLSLVISCESRADTVSCFPSQIINVQLNLNLPAYAIDLNTKGWIYINEQQSGTRGLILVKKAFNTLNIFIIRKNFLSLSK